MLDGMRSHYDGGNKYNNDFLLLSSNVFLSGYFQDIRYLLTYQDKIIDDILLGIEKFLTQPDKKLKVSTLPINTRIGAMHVRRGDYLQHPEFYPEWFETYYLAVASSILERAEIDALDIFTDDPKWCLETFKDFGEKVNILSPDRRYEGLCDLYQMSRYAVLGIANSTFSWWAGAIATKRGAHVICPEIWSTWCDVPKERLYLPSWQVLSS
jgi:hypothetical protein